MTFPADYRVSSYCSHGGCVGFIEAPDGSIMLRDTKKLQGPSLTFTRAEWKAFVAGVKDGEFDVE